MITKMKLAAVAAFSSKDAARKRLTSPWIAREKAGSACSGAGLGLYASDGQSLVRIPVPDVLLSTLRHHVGKSISEEAVKRLARVPAVAALACLRDGDFDDECAPDVNFLTSVLTNTSLDWQSNTIDELVKFVKEAEAYRATSDVGLVGGVAVFGQVDRGEVVYDQFFAGYCVGLGDDRWDWGPAPRLRIGGLSVASSSEEQRAYELEASLSALSIPLLVKATRFLRTAGAKEVQVYADETTGTFFFRSSQPDLAVVLAGTRLTRHDVRRRESLLDLTYFKKDYSPPTDKNSAGQGVVYGTTVPFPSRVADQLKVRQELGQRADLPLDEMQQFAELPRKPHMLFFRGVTAWLYAQYADLSHFAARSSAGFERSPYDPKMWLGLTVRHGHAAQAVYLDSGRVIQLIGANEAIPAARRKKAQMEIHRAMRKMLAQNKGA